MFIAIITTVLIAGIIVLVVKRLLTNPNSGREEKRKVMMEKVEIHDTPDAEPERPEFHTLCERGSVGPLRQFLQSREDTAINAGDPTFHGWTGLHFAAHHGHLDIVRELLPEAQHTESGPGTVDEFGSLPLHYAAHQGHVEVVGLLLEHRAVT